MVVPKRKGRPTKPPREGERIMLGVRVTPAMKRQIDEEARKSGRSLSQEAEIRLERSFEEGKASLDLPLAPLPLVFPAPAGDGADAHGK